MCWPWDCRDRRVKVAIGHCKAGQGGGGKPDEVYYIYIIYIYNIFILYVLVLGIDIRFGVYIYIRYIFVFFTTWHVLFCILYVVLLVVAMNTTCSLTSQKIARLFTMWFLLPGMVLQYHLVL